MRNKRWMVVNWFFLIIWMWIIFYFSSVPNLRISEQWWDLILRKIAHFSEFFVLSWLWCRALVVTKTDILRSHLILLSCGLSIFYAFLDEFHQSFVPTRHASLMDVFIDSLGVLFFGVLLSMRIKRIHGWFL